MSGKTNITILESARCTGCGVCENSCPTGAISFGEDAEGFRMPFVDDSKCINCKACVRACPVLTLQKHNRMQPDMYAVRAKDDVRAVSSSGGVFSLLADYVLEKGGCVCGAAFDEDMTLRHVMITNKSELAKLRGSKYVQSNTGDIYSRVKAKLKEDKTVLFVGTPCQVAGVKNFIGSEQNLITADILCHGVPSQKSLDKYLAEISEGKKIKDVAFRDKRNGWNAEHITITFEDGTVYDKSAAEGNLYVKAFLSNIMLRRSCENCPFCAFPRHGDISMGDFWGISNFDKSQSDGKGTSIVFVNNAAGKALFEKAVLPAATVRQFAFSENMPNRIKSYFRANAKRNQFLNNLRVHSYKDAMDFTQKNRFDIGLVSNYCAVNFGGSLTQFALYCVLEDMGYTVLMIDRPASAPDKILSDVRTICYEKWPYPEYALAAQYPTKEAMRELNDLCDTFVVGSDQLFQNTLFNFLGGIYTLDWVENTKKKIACAASFGFDYVWGERRQLAEMGYFMQQFDAFSVREDSGVKVARDYFGVEAVHILDPVFLCDTRHYDQLIAHSKREISGGYISSYILDPTDEKKQMLKTLQSSLGLRVEVFSELGNKNSGQFEGFDYVPLKAEGRLQSIKNASFFLCDSFHGTCLAIIFNVPFISVVNSRRGGARFSSLLKYFGLEDRMVETLEEFKSRPELLKPTDFSYANKKLKKGREFSLNWLRDALRKESKKGASIYDILTERLAERDREIRNLKNLVKNLYKEKSLLPFTDTIADYLAELKRNKARCIYIVAVKDTPGISVTEDMAKKLNESLGVRQNLFQQHWKSYAAVVDGGKVVFEKLSEGRVETALNVEGYNIQVVSAALGVGNLAKIMINGKDYAVNKRGFNIVAIDKTDGRVCDCAQLDLHLRNYVLEHREIF